MKKHKIHKARMLFFLAFGTVVLGVSLYEVSRVLALSVNLVGLLLLFGAGWASRCPQCGEYLTLKRNWIGRSCKHCGEKVE